MSFETPLPDYYYTLGRPEIVELLPPDLGSVLDVGCGAGGFGAAVKAANPSVCVVGIEPEAEPARVASAIYDHVDVGLFPAEFTAAFAPYDCVVFNDVLEHMPDPWSALRAAHEHVAPGGCVVVSLPNIANTEILRGLVRLRFDYQPSGVLDRTHLRFFTRPTATEMLQSCGYEVMSTRLLWKIHAGGKARLLSRVSKRFVELNHRQVAFVTRPMKGSADPASAAVST